MKPEYSVEAGKKKLKLNNRKKNLSNKGREPNKFNSDMAPLPGFKPRLNSWEVNALTSAQHFLFFQTSLRLFQLTQIDKVRRFFGESHSSPKRTKENS